MRLESSSEKRAGRPRDERARRCVLDAVRELLHQGGLCGASMEGLARQAGVGKQTLYRWWPSLADVVLEALLEETGEAAPLPAAGEPLAQLQAFLRQTFHPSRQHTGPLLRCLMVEAQKNEAFREKFFAGFVRSRREALLGVLQPLSRAGGTDPALVADLIQGLLWYRLLVRHAPPGEAEVEELIQAVQRLLQPVKPRKRA